MIDYRRLNEGSSIARKMLKNCIHEGKAPNHCFGRNQAT